MSIHIHSYDDIGTGTGNVGYRIIDIDYELIYIVKGGVTF